MSQHSVDAHGLKRSHSAYRPRRDVAHIVHAERAKSVATVEASHTDNACKFGEHHLLELTATHERAVAYLGIVRQNHPAQGGIAEQPITHIARRARQNHILETRVAEYSANEHRGILLRDSAFAVRHSARLQHYGAQVEFAQLPFCGSAPDVVAPCHVGDEEHVGGIEPSAHPHLLYAIAVLLSHKLLQGTRNSHIHNFHFCLSHAASKHQQHGCEKCFQSFHVSCFFLESTPKTQNGTGFRQRDAVFKDI